MLGDVFPVTRGRCRISKADSGAKRVVFKPQHDEPVRQTRSLCAVVFGATALGQHRHEVRQFAVEQPTRTLAIWYDPH